MINDVFDVGVTAAIRPVLPAAIFHAATPAAALKHRAAAATDASVGVGGPPKA